MYYVPPPDEPPASQQAALPEAAPTPEGDSFFDAIRPINAAGFVMVAASFLPALCLATILKDERESFLLALGGPLAVGIDLWYRLRNRQLSADLFWPGRGGKFVYLPVWVAGISWSLLGLWQLSD